MTKFFFLRELKMTKLLTLILLKKKTNMGLIL